MEFSNYNLDGTAATDGYFMTLPSGFRSSNSAHLVSDGGNTIVNVGILSNGAAVYFGGVGVPGAQVRTTFSWLAFEGWPDPLPGTADAAQLPA